MKQLKKQKHKIECNHVLSDRNGLYSVQLKSGDRLFISCNYIGYREIRDKVLNNWTRDKLSISS